MRVYAIVMALPMLALAACGGAGPETVGSVSPPSGSTGSGGSGGTGGGVTPTPSATPTPTPTPTANGGTGTGVGVGGVGGAAATTFLTGLTTDTTFQAIGAMHSFNYTQDSNGNVTSLYQGNASTVNTASGTISYSPRDGIFSIAFADTKAGISVNTAYQDPAHRTDFDKTRMPSQEVPNLGGFNYLQAGNSTDLITFFYQRPDATTYVTLAGFARTTSNTTYVTSREKGVFAFGSLTPQSQIPTSGTGTYTGGFLASAVLNPSLDSNAPMASYLQWIAGNSTIAIDFGRSTVKLDFVGTVSDVFRNGTALTDVTYGGGTAFTASGHATIDLIRSGGFTGGFDSATLAGKAIDFRGISAGSNVAGASSIDGTFFGPNGVNVGGDFRIIGGVPDQRVDIQGAFTGAKK